MKTDTIIFQFIPIILSVLFLVYTSITVQFSTTILGKIVALIIIMYYASEDVLYGTIACGIFIIYYRTLYIEGMDTMFEEHMPSPLRAQFSKQYCDNGVLKYKQTPVKQEMTTHVFPEINFTYTACNPCDEMCEYSIIEEKLKNDDEMRKPKDSNETDWISQLLGLTSLEGGPVPAIGVVSEQFSYFDSQ